MFAFQMVHLLNEEFYRRNNFQKIISYNVPYPKPRYESIALAQHYRKQ